MKKIFFLLIIFTLFYACEKEVKPTEKIQKSNIESIPKKDTITVWYPKKVSSIRKSHRVLVSENNQNYDIQTEYVSLENSSVDQLISNQDNFTIYKYRDYHAIIKITDNKDAFQFYKVLKKELFLNETGKELQEKGILMSFEYDSFKNNKFYFIIRICQPETDYCSQIDYIVDLEGNTRKETPEYSEDDYEN